MGEKSKTIEFWPCRYQVLCKVRDCKFEATIIARSIDAGGRPIRQYELCSVHADQFVQGAKLRGWDVVRHEGGQ